MQTLKLILKKEPVFSVAALLALVSMLLVHPSADYLGYIDFKTLTLLFCLMAAVAGWQMAGVFRKLAQFLLKKLKNVRQLVLILVFLCFFSSMFITNDVALITFVPLAVLVLGQQRRNLLIRTVALQTIAANLGSMLLPVGNPQNLYLYGLSGMGLVEFILLLLPCWAVSLVLLLLSGFLIPKDSLELSVEIPGAPHEERGGIFYGILFALCLATVAGVLPYYILLPIVIAAILIYERRLLRQVDYVLLLTFVCFFIFIGNMKSLPAVAALLSRILQGHEFLFALVASQVISNVPAAILLSGFTNQIRPLILGTDIGGLGTLIASLASLISFNIYRKTEGCQSMKYLLVFTGLNLIFLAVLCLTVFLV